MQAQRAEAVAVKALEQAKQAHVGITSLLTYNTADSPQANSEMTRGHPDADTKWYIAGCLMVDHDLTAAVHQTCLQESGELQILRGPAEDTSSNEIRHLQWMRRRQTRIQYYTLDWILKRLMLLVRCTGNAPVRDNASSDHRAEIFVHSFDTVPLAICRSMHSNKLKAAGFEQIWALADV